MGDEIKDIGASVRQRLLNRSRKRGEDFQALAVRYAIERLLYRLSVSHYRDKFILKGAMLFAVWTEMPYRPTRDLDLLGFVDDDEDAIKRAIREICTIGYDDGLSFDTDTIITERIREEQEYQGVRVKFKAFLGKAKLSIQVDIGFGDTVTPGAQRMDYPVILDFPKPSLRAYPVESVVSEKLQAIVALGMTNSRMKDYYDLWTITNRFNLDGAQLSKAIRATFDRRDTPIPETIPVGLSDDFAADDGHQRQWKAFLRKMDFQTDVELLSVIGKLYNFFLPLLESIVQEMAFRSTWYPEGVWKKRGDK
jgi:predicted nucleotidyltransferase component of viral defense system